MIIFNLQDIGEVIRSGKIQLDKVAQLTHDKDRPFMKIIHPHCQMTFTLGYLKRLMLMPHIPHEVSDSITAKYDPYKKRFLVQYYYNG